MRPLLHILTLKVDDKAQAGFAAPSGQALILHADFQRVQADEKLRMTVPIHFLNESNCKGVRLGGGVVSP